MQVAVRLGELDVGDVIVECIVGPDLPEGEATLRLEFEYAGRNDAGEAIVMLPRRTGWCASQ